MPHSPPHVVRRCQAKGPVPAAALCRDSGLGESTSLQTLGEAHQIGRGAITLRPVCGPRPAKSKKAMSDSRLRLQISVASDLRVGSTKHLATKMQRRTRMCFSCLHRRCPHPPWVPSSSAANHSRASAATRAEVHIPQHVGEHFVHRLYTSAISALGCCKDLSGDAFEGLHHRGSQCPVRQFFWEDTMVLQTASQHMATETAAGCHLPRSASTTSQ